MPFQVNIEEEIVQVLSPPGMDYIPLNDFAFAGVTRLDIGSLGRITDVITDRDLLKPDHQTDIYVGKEPDASRFAAELRSYESQGIKGTHFPLPWYADAVVVVIPDNLWRDPQGRTLSELAEMRKAGGLNSILHDLQNLARRTGL